MALLALGIIWTVFGMIGFSGCLKLQMPKEVKNKQQYRRLYSIGYLMIGIPYLAAFAYLMRTNQDINIWISDLLILVLWIPGMMYETWLDHKVKKEAETTCSIAVSKKVA